VFIKIKQIWEHGSSGRVPVWPSTSGPDFKPQSKIFFKKTAPECKMGKVQPGVKGILPSILKF
jgi:hypothetical protein